MNDDSRDVARTRHDFVELCFTRFDGFSASRRLCVRRSLEFPAKNILATLFRPSSDRENHRVVCKLFENARVRFMRGRLPSSLPLASEKRETQNGARIFLIFIIRRRGLILADR